MTLQVRPAQLKDLGAIEALYRQQVREAERSPLKRQFASTRLWFLLNSTFASIIPITSAAYDYLPSPYGRGGPGLGSLLAARRVGPVEKEYLGPKLRIP